MPFSQTSPSQYAPSGQHPAPGHANAVASHAVAGESSQRPAGVLNARLSSGSSSGSWCLDGGEIRPTDVMLSRVHVEGVEHLRRAAAAGRGILVLTAHYGNWELLAAAHGLTGLPLSFVVRPLDDPILDDLAGRFRRRSGAELIVKHRAVREVMQALRRGRMVGILLDQNATRGEGVFVPFFGVPASTSKGLALLALRTGAPVVPVFLRREPDGRHCMDVRPPLPAPPDEDVLTYTAAFNAAIEAAIRRAPEQWLWMHARWRTRPREVVS